MTAPGAATLPEALTILAEAAEVGGEGGLLGGPVGALIGVGLGLTAGGLIILALERANKDHSGSKPGSLEECPSNAAAEADEEVECFKRPAGAGKDEFERAVKMAEAEINKLSPERFLRRLHRLEPRTAAGLRAQKTVERAHRRARIAWIKNYLRAMPFLFQGLREELPLTPKEAAASLSREFKRVHLEHRLDIGGGGNPKKFAGLGDSLINESIGGQWTEARLATLKRKAEKAKRDGKKTMDVKLNVCPEEAT
jgi:hypothetical protein